MPGPEMPGPEMPGPEIPGDRRPADQPKPQTGAATPKETLARAPGHQIQRGPEAEAQTAQQSQDQSDSDDIRSGDSAIPSFLAVSFVMFGLWGAWYFAFHLAPLDQPQPASVLAARPPVVRSYQAAAADPAVTARPSTFDPTGEYSAFDLTATTAQLQTGSALFQGRCAQCHGADGQGRNPPLEAAMLQNDPVIWTMPPSRVAQMVHYGFSGLMPQWGNDQDQASLAEVVGYLNKVMSPPPGTPSRIDISSGGVNAGHRIQTYTRPWEQADGVKLAAVQKEADPSGAGQSGAGQSGTDPSGAKK